MFREHLPPDQGMLFLMKEVRAWPFWMRNTLIPLDMIFIAKDLTIAGIVENAEPRTETLREVDRPVAVRPRGQRWLLRGAQGHRGRQGPVRGRSLAVTVDERALRRCETRSCTRPPA